MVVVAVDEAVAEAGVHGTEVEVEVMITMLMVMEETDGESMSAIPFCFASIA